MSKKFLNVALVGACDTADIAKVLRAATEQLMGPAPVPFSPPGAWNYHMLAGDSAPGGFVALQGSALLDAAKGRRAAPSPPDPARDMATVVEYLRAAHAESAERLEAAEEGREEDA